uniref:Uncharacterized protein n=1 Tax=Anguilla anguilla TaxID=7936 RepID=A0A0E9RSY6_ANGAN
MSHMTMMLLSTVGGMGCISIATVSSPTLFLSLS